MIVENKYNISDLVKFGPYTAIVTGIRLTGEPLNILYEVSYFNGVDAYVAMVVNDYELESEKEEFGFRSKERERLEAENAPLKSPFDPRFDHLNCGNQDDM